MIVSESPMLTGLPSIHLLSAARFEVFNNPQLSECSLLEVIARTQTDLSVPSVPENNLACTP